MESRQSRRFAGVTGHFVVSKVGGEEIFGKSNFGLAEYELRNNFIGFKIECYEICGTRRLRG